MVNLLFEPKHFQTVELTGKSPKCETIENISKAVTTRLSCYELGNTVDFLQAESVYTMTKDPMIFSLPISDILSTKDRTEKKRFSKKSFLTIETAKHTIDFENMTELEINALKQFLDIQKEKEVLGNKSKKITFTADGSTKTLTICPYSSTVLDNEEIIYSRTFPAIGFVVTNYRVWENHFFEIDGISMTHDEYDEVITTDVTRRREEDIVGGVTSRSSIWNLLQPTSLLPALGIEASGGFQYDISYNKSEHHASSVESEFGDIVFMKNGKQVMIWKNFMDPNSAVKLINSAKAHFSTTPTAPSSSGGEDPIKALKLRFAKGEITKEEFLEMKSMLE
jgi:hypothetical protein